MAEPSRRQLAIAANARERCVEAVLTAYGRPLPDGSMRKRCPNTTTHDRHLWFSQSLSSKTLDQNMTCPGYAAPLVAASH